MHLTAAQARRIALAAQGFAEPRPSGRIDARHLRKVLARIGLLQLDSVNVFCRSHYLPVFARLGPYPRDLLDTLTAHTDGPVRRELFEYWAHEASLVPVELQPLLRWRMARADSDAWAGVRRIARERPTLLADVVELIRERGPIRSSDTGIEPIDKRPGQMWNWHDGKIALEYLFYAGRVTAARRVNFERYYDLPENVLPAQVLATPTPPDEDAYRELIRVAARAHGVGTEPDLRDYFRMPHRETQGRRSPSWSSPASSSRSRWTGGASRPTSGTRRAGRAASTRARCCRRSTTWSGSASAPSGSSGCTTGSRSTRRRPNASTATTCCRSCSATTSSRAWT